MSVKRTLVEITHDEGYGDALLEYINNNLRGKDMLAERIVTIQEIIESIEAEIEATQKLSSKVRLTSNGAAVTILGHMAYVNGLRFSKELIEKRIEVTE